MKNKVSCFFKAFLPLIIAVALQFLVTLPLLEGIILKVLFSGFRNNTSIFDDLSDTLTNLSSTAIISILYSIASIIVFGIWAHNLNKRREFSFGNGFNIRAILPMIVMALSLQFAAEFITEFISSVNPGAYEYYEELIKSTGITSGGIITVILVIYGACLAPISEELIFRNITLRYARIALPFWLANIMQAALFALFHFNLIQGSYAFVVGMFCGYIYHKSGKIKSSITFHIIFNLLSVAVANLFIYVAEFATILKLIIFIGCMIVALLCCRWYAKNLSV